ncbi:hypothetical protein GQX74_001960 [Glossina fuscipes]|nr:hypothetical protein GQX74_001960 [Glossina fuscipes]
MSSIPEHSTFGSFMARYCISNESKRSTCYFATTQLSLKAKLVKHIKVGCNDIATTKESMLACACNDFFLINSNISHQDCGLRLAFPRHKVIKNDSRIKQCYGAGAGAVAIAVTVAVAADVQSAAL